MQCRQVLAADFTCVIKHLCENSMSKMCAGGKVLHSVKNLFHFSRIWTDLRWPRQFYNRTRLCIKFTIIYVPIDFAHISVCWILIGKQTKIERIHTLCWWGKVREGNHLEGLGVGGRIILKYLLKKHSKAWIGLIWLRIWISGILCEHGNEAWGAMNCWAVFYWRKKSINFSILPYKTSLPPRTAV